MKKVFGFILALAVVFICSIEDFNTQTSSNTYQNYTVDNR